jgi:hypothetical protein
VKPLEALAAMSDKDVRYGAVRRPAISDIVLEPISPELVLVDPELRRKVLAQLLEDVLLEALPEPAPRPSQIEPAPKPVEPAVSLPRPAAPMPLSQALHRPGQVAPKRRRRRRLAPALLPVSLAVNVIVIALSVSDARIARTSPSSPLAIDPPVPSQLAPPTTKSPSAKKAQRPAASAKRRATRKSKPGASKRAAAMRETRGKVEQKVLNTVIQSPAGKLPRALIDPKTGLAKNNLQAVCRRTRGFQSFLCVVQPVQHKRGEGLYVRYSLNRNGTGGRFVGFRYRRG